MATVKVILRKKVNKDGTSPLALRITKDRKSSYIYLGYSLHEHDWDATEQKVRRSHPNSVRLNNFLLKKRSEATNNTLELETNQTDIHVKAVKNKLKPTAGITFFPQAEAYLAKLKNSGKYNQYTADKPRVKHFREFIGHDISFQDITPVLLEQFKGYVKMSVGLSERSAVNALVMVRSVFSHAIKDRVLDAKYYPFGKGKVKIKFPDSVKVGLTPQEITALEKVDLPDPFHNHVRNLWLFSFYFAGMRVSDVLRLKWSDIQNNRLHYAMGKNNKAGSLKIPDKALAILKQYKKKKPESNNLIFPELREAPFDNAFLLQRTIAFKTSAVDKCLRTHIASKAGITKTLTMHVSRHSFGNISGDKIPIQVLQKLYRHSSVLTTIGYQQNFVHQEVDEALEAVLQL